MNDDRNEENVTNTTEIKRGDLVSEPGWSKPSKMVVGGCLIISLSILLVGAFVVSTVSDKIEAYDHEAGIWYCHRKTLINE